MFNALSEIPKITKLVQLGVRDFSEEEFNYIQNSNQRVVSYFDRDIKEKLFEGHTWRSIVDEIVQQLPSMCISEF